MARKLKARLVQWLDDIYERFVVSRYVKFGLILGDTDSYSYMGEPVGYDRLEKKFLKWEREYQMYGYQAVPRETWMRAGGYGWPYKHLLRITEKAHFQLLLQDSC